MLYIKGGEDAKNIQELITKLINSDYNGTYFDKECKKRHCYASFRSFTDLCELCKTYFPESTEEEIAYVLLNDFRTNAWYCTDIKRVVFSIRIEDYKRATYDRFMCTNRETGNGYPTDYEDEMDLSYDKIKKLAENYKPVV